MKCSPGLSKNLTSMVRLAIIQCVKKKLYKDADFWKTRFHYIHTVTYSHWLFMWLIMHKILDCPIAIVLFFKTFYSSFQHTEEGRQVNTHGAMT